jgi:phage FluMu protein Com
MPDGIKYIWRCAKCTYHFSNVVKMDGVLKQEKKCPKCKCVNMLTMSNSEIYIQCKSPEDDLGGYEYGRDKDFYPPV